jgi:hypothetical protein
MAARRAVIAVSLIFAGACGAHSKQPALGAQAGEGGAFGSAGVGGSGAPAGTGGLASGAAGNAVGSAGGTSGVGAPGVGNGQAGRGVGGTGGSAGGAGHAGGSVGGAAGPSAAGSSAGGHGGGAGGAAGGSTAPAGLMPVYRIPLRVHTALSQLTEADLMSVLAEMNDVWLSQAGICFEIEVTASETNRSDGFDFRYTAGQIPGASTANGLTQNAHSIWSIDHPNLGAAPHPIMNPTARTTAHELGHALNLAHENPAPSTDCSSPCYCVTLNMDCNDFLMRSGTKGYFLSDPEIQIARKRAMSVALADTTPLLCGAPVFM